jgi:hypothetical protein
MCKNVESFQKYKKIKRAYFLKFINLAVNIFY